MAAPVININTSGAFGLTLIDDADSTTGWVGFNDGGGGTPTVQSETDLVLQGSAAVSVKISGNNQNKGLWFDTTSGVDMTVTGRHLYIWCANTTPKSLATIANGGLYIKVASDASGDNWNKYYVDGNDVRVDGRFQRYVIDLNKIPSETAATAATLTSIRFFGIGINHVSDTVKSENLIVDRMDYGDGLQMEAGDATDPMTWQALFDDDTLAANKYGIIEERSGVFYLKGGITIGDPAGTVTSLWSHNNSPTVVFEDPQYYNGEALVSAIDGPNLYKIEELGNGTGTTDLDWGSVVGTGDDRQGIGGGLIRSDGPKFELDFETDIADLDTVNLYGVQVIGAGLCRFSGSTKTDLIGCTFTNCDEVQPNDADWLGSRIVAPVPARGLEILSSSDVTKSSLVSGITGPVDTRKATRVWQNEDTPLVFVEFTEEFASAATGDVIPFPPTEAVDDYFAMGSDRIFGGVNIDVGTARSGGSLAWNYWNGSSWGALTIHTDDTNTLSTTGPNPVQWNPPNDWARVSLRGEDPLYYVRLVVTGTMSTNPVIDEGDITRIQEHLLHYPVAITDTVDEVICFGAAIHVENSDDGVTEDNYGFGNQNTTVILGADTITGRGQSITGSGGVLASVQAQMSKASGTDTADILCKVYAHSGTFGSSSIPTGPALATSNPLSTDELSELGVRRVVFEFEDKFTLVNTTNYVVTFEVAALFASGQVNVGIDNSSPTHGGNAVSLIPPTWSAQSHDTVFVVSSGAILTLNLTNGSVVDTDINTSEANPGATIINNTVTARVTCLDADTLGVIVGARVLLEAAAGGDLPVAASVTIVSTGTLATVTHTAHGMANGQTVVIRGANEPEYNCVAVISNVGTNAYDYTMPGDPASPATGTITSTGIILNGTTNGSGIIEDTAFNFTSDQPVTGKARKGTVTPLYSTAPILGTITSPDGLDTTAFMVPDE